MTTSIKTNREEAKKHLAQTQNGTIVIGNPGVGKTTLVRKPRMVNAAVLANEYKIHGIDAVKAHINSQIEYQAMTVVIDDLGTEENVRHFGNTLDPVAYVIQRIYDINQVAEQKIKLIVTTNFNQKELEDKYGIRVIERLWEMCDRVIIEDTNLRKK